MPEPPDDYGYASCRWCSRELPLNTSTWFVHRATGGLHTESRCRDCERSYRAGLSRRRNVRSAATITADLESIPTLAFDRAFGVEIEFQSASRQTVANRCGRNGITCERMSYTHEVLDYWKVITDDTVEGGELVSPPLRGADGRRQVVAASRGLKDAGADVDVSCGLHVHHDVQDLSAAAIIRTINNYYVNQDAIDGLVAKSRRSTGYCSYSHEIARDTIEHLVENGEPADMSLDEFRRRCYMTDRYYNINISCYPSYGTIEFRQHGGTVNAEKILAWVAFGQSLIAASVAGVTLRSSTADGLISVLSEHGLAIDAATFLRERARHFARARAGVS